VNTGEGEMEGTKCHAQCELNVCVRALRNVVCVCWRTVGLGGGEGGVGLPPRRKLGLGAQTEAAARGHSLCVVLRRAAVRHAARQCERCRCTSVQCTSVQ